MKRLAFMAMAMLMVLTMSAQTSEKCDKKCEKACEKTCEKSSKKECNKKECDKKESGKECNKKCDKMSEKNCEKECGKNMHSVAFLYEKDLQWENAEPGVKRQIMGYNGQLMVVKVKFEKGAVGKAHTHPHTQSTYVASGKFEVTIDGEKKILEAGDGYYVAPNALHGAVCLKAGVLIDTFSPMRADFLGKK